MTHMGTYNELIASSSSFCHLLDNIHQQEQEHPTDVHSRHRAKSMSISEQDNEEDLLLLNKHSEMKREGSVNWQVYVSYLRAGAGLIFGTFLVTCIFGLREVASVYYKWWLAKWSDEESYRHREFNNCTDGENQKIKMIQTMNETQWNDYRNERFYYYCGW